MPNIASQIRKMLRSTEGRNILRTNDVTRNSFSWPDDLWRGTRQGFRGREKIVALYRRHRRFVEHMTEKRHNWQFVQRIYFVDNSTEIEQQSSLTGEIRRVLEIAPRGDVC